MSGFDVHIKSPFFIEVVADKKIGSEKKSIFSVKYPDHQEVYRQLNQLLFHPIL